MIRILTLNPALDVCVLGQRKYYYAGGKGVNVARALNKFGISSLSMVFVGGDTGCRWVKMIEREGLRARTFAADGETRTIVTYYDRRGPRQTTGGIIPTFSQKDIFQKKLKSVVKHNDWLVVSGSSPGQDMRLYDNALSHISSRRLIMDVNGKALNELLRFQPYFIKPNQQEAEQCLGVRLTSENKIRAGVERLHKKGAVNVMLSLGEKGVAAFVDGDYYRCKISSSIQAPYSLGCGDILVAGYLAFHHLPAERMLIKSVAAASAGARQLKPGFFLKKHSQLIERQIEVAKYK